MALTHNALSSPPHIDPSTTPDDDGADNFNWHNWKHLTHNALSKPPHIDPSTTPDDDGADNFNRHNWRHLTHSALSSPPRCPTQRSHLDKYQTIQIFKFQNQGNSSQVATSDRSILDFVGGPGLLWGLPGEENTANHWS